MDCGLKSSVFGWCCITTLFMLFYVQLKIKLNSRLRKFKRNCKLMYNFATRSRIKITYKDLQNIYLQALISFGILHKNQHNKNQKQ